MKTEKEEWEDVDSWRGFWLAVIWTALGHVAAACCVALYFN